MTKEKVSVTIDDREPGELLEHLTEHEDIENWGIDRLETDEGESKGDIWIDDAGVLIERKTISDFASSITNGHLPSQVERMSQMTDNAYILVEGDMGDFDASFHSDFTRDTMRKDSGSDSAHYSNLSGESMRGYTASVMARNDIPVVFCSTQKLLIDMAVRLGRKHIEEPTRNNLFKTRKVDLQKPVVQRMLSCVEGVGPSIAESLNKEFSSMREVMKARKEDFSEIDGIGDKTADKIYCSLRGNAD